MSKMTESDMWSEIRKREASIDDLNSKIREAERTLEDLDRMRSRFAALIRHLEEERQGRLQAITKAIPGIAFFRFGTGPKRFADRYSQNMRELISGNNFMRAYQKIETGKHVMNKNMQDLMDAINQMERAIDRDRNAIQWLRQGVSACRDEALARQAAERRLAEAPEADVTKPEDIKFTEAYTWENYHFKYGMFFRALDLPQMRLVLMKMGG